MRVLFASAEIYPLAKTGGLADVSAALPQALAALGVDVRPLVPGYRQALARATHKSVVAELRPFGDSGPSRLVAARLPDSDQPLWIVDCPRYFDRPGDPYRDEAGGDWPDNAARFAYFSRVAADLAMGRVLQDWRADIVHGNDWHTGLLPLLLGAENGARPGTVFTLHNLAYQGVFPAAIGGQLDLPAEVFTSDGVEFYGQISFLKAGIRYGDRVTTVSPSYAEEILTPEYGCGLEGVLRQRAECPLGILNGADYGIWNPSADQHAASCYDARHLGGKRDCKEAVRAEFGLNEDESPLLVWLSRITHQKMADVLAEALPRIIERGAQIALLGDGDHWLEAQLRDAVRPYPGRAALRLGYEEPLAHRLQAGGDMLLLPARYEPCGLSQLYAMRYGTLPVVRATGGLRDTVVDASEEALRRGIATGFAFREPTAEGLLGGIDRATTLYHHPISWRRMQRHAMARDFGWSRSAHRYLNLYCSLAPGAAILPPAAEFEEFEALAAE
ncbi:MAG: glycogen synthase GlgA [Stellaceae bacterium]